MNLIEMCEAGIAGGVWLLSIWLGGDDGIVMLMKWIVAVE